jgi:predicted nucleic-acid-binding Zn-ribbon protein
MQGAGGLAPAGRSAGSAGPTLAKGEGGHSGAIPRSVHFRHLSQNCSIHFIARRAVHCTTTHALRTLIARSGGRCFHYFLIRYSGRSTSPVCDVRQDQKISKRCCRCRYTPSVRRSTRRFSRLRRAARTSCRRPCRPCRTPSRPDRRTASAGAARWAARRRARWSPGPGTASGRPFRSRGRSCRRGSGGRPIASIYPMHGFIGIQALDSSRDTPSHTYSFNSSALCDTLVLGCHRVPIGTSSHRLGSCYSTYGRTARADFALR